MSRLWLAALLIAAGCSHGRLKPGPGEQGEVIESEGWSPSDGDLLKSRQRALAEAQRKAVERVVGVFISAKTRVDAAVHVDSRIMANVEGYIRKYDVLEERNEAGFFKMRIRALVLYRKIGDDLRELGLLRPPPPPGNPRVSVLLKPDGAAGSGSLAARGVRTALVERGFAVIDGEGAYDLAVTGDADAHPIEDSRLAGFRSFRARVSLQASKMGSSQLLSRKTQEASALDPSPEVARAKALDVAGAMAGEALAAELSKALASRIEVRLRIHGIKGLEKIRAVAEDVRGNPGVAAVTLSAYRDGIAELQVTTERIPGDELAALMLRMRSHRFAARSVSPYEVELEGQ